MIKSLTDLETTLANLQKKYGYLKVNLVREGETGGNGEGIWAVPVDDESKQTLNSESSQGEFAMVRVCNMPFSWENLTWGGLVRAKTLGSKRPAAYLPDQDLPEIKEDWANLAKIFESAKEVQDGKPTDTQIVP